MATTVDPAYGIRVDASVAASTVREYTLPAWTRSVQVKAPESGGADLEVAWSGTDTNGSSTANQYSVIKAGGADLYEVPIAVKAAGNAPKIYVRPTSTSATTIEIRCHQSGV